MKLLSGLTVILISAGAALAAPGVAVTVYNQNLALVRDTRPMDYKSGTGEILFRDVSAQIDATSVHFSANGVAMLEQNFDYDLVSPDKLTQKYVDQEVEVVSKTGDVARGVLLTSGAGISGAQIVLREAEGAVRSILMENIAEIRYPKLPQGLITRPTLRWLVDAASGGSKETEVSYLTTGLSWRADYVLLLNEANTKAGLDAWVTVENTCGTSYENAQLKLIAGEVNRVRQPRPMADMYEARAVPSIGAAKSFEEQSFFEYHLYTLQRPTTLLDQQTKQVSLFPSTETPVRKIYQYDWQRNNERVGVSAEFENRQSSGLGMPLPAGRVRVYQEGQNGNQEFVGEDNIEHTPKDEKVTVNIGNAFDIAAERQQMDYRRVSDRVNETDFQVKLRNHKTEKVEVVVVEHLWGDWEILRSSIEFKKISANKVEFRVPVEPDKETTLTYTVRNR